MRIATRRRPVVCPGRGALPGGLARMSKFGPTRGEMWFRLCFSLLGLALMGFALATRGFGGIAWVEVVVIAGAFFGGTAAWSARRLWLTREGR